MGWGPALGGVGATLDTARAAAARRDWVAARDAFAAVSEQLTADDLYAYGNCHWWMGDLATALPILQDAHRAYLAEGAPRRAALVAIDIGYWFALRGEEAQATGWMGRAVRLLDAEPDCAEKGYLVYIGFEDAWGANDLDTAMERGHQVHAIGSRFGEPNLCALGVLAQGRVLVKLGRVREGMALLDEAMVAAVSDDLDPGWAGNIYCHLMLACYELADWRRAQEWTDVTARWCQQMPGAGPFLGICRVHRAQVLQARGEWSTAEDEVVRVCAELDGFHHGMVAEAQYHLGDLRRQRGDLAGAEAAFAEADRLGRDPQPGRALLRLAQGDRSAARSEIEPACTAAGTDPLARARLLPARTPIAIACGDLDTARAATAELEDVAARYGTPGLAARAALAVGELALAEARPADGVTALRAAVAACQRAQVPYEAALARRLLADAYDAVGHSDAARRERDLAAAELARLGAATGPAPARADGLTAREAEVLALLAGGLTNQEIADRLVLSVRTVERHLATVYRKLGLEGRNARAAAVRYALTVGGPAAMT